MSNHEHEHDYCLDCGRCRTRECLTAEHEAKWQLRHNSDHFERIAHAAIALRALTRHWKPQDIDLANELGRAEEGFDRAVEGLSSE